MERWLAVLLCLALSGCAGSSVSTTTVTSTPDAALSSDSQTTDSQSTDSGLTDSTPSDSSSSTDQGSAESPGSYSHSDDAGFCSSHQCIANFPNGNGYVVQCVDSEWSHSGGLSGSCSYHGGEGPGSGSQAAQTSSSTSGGSQPLSNQCDANVSATSGATCPFAENTFYEYYRASGGDASQSETISAWSPTTHQYYSEDCSPSSGVVSCTFGSETIQLTTSGLTAYSESQASAYASSHDLGPNG